MKNALKKQTIFFAVFLLLCIKSYSQINLMKSLLTGTIGDKTWWVAIYEDAERGTRAEVYNNFKAKRTFYEVQNYFLSDNRDCDSFIWLGYREYKTLCGGNPATYMVNNYGTLVDIHPLNPPDERPENKPKSNSNSDYYHNEPRHGDH